MTVQSTTNPGTALAAAYAAFLDVARENVEQSIPPTDGPSADAARLQMLSALQHFLREWPDMPRWLAGAAETPDAFGVHVEDDIWADLAVMTPETLAGISATEFIGLWVTAHVFGVYSDLLRDAWDGESDDPTDEEKPLWTRWRNVLDRAPLPGPLASILAGKPVRREDAYAMLSGVDPDCDQTLVPLWAGPFEPTWGLGHRVLTSDAAIAGRANANARTFL